jgi:hypothetical protein
VKKQILLTAAAGCLCHISALSPASAQTICGTWSPFTGPNAGGPTQSPWVRRIIRWDHGGGDSLIIAGRFHGAVPSLRNIARFDGEVYHPLASGLGASTSGEVRDLIIFDDGAGPMLYAAGEFSVGPFGSDIGLARWMGTAWASPLPFSPISYGHGRALAVHDDGSGEALFIAMQNALVRFQNSTASIVVGAPAPGYTYALVSFDDGTGPALYVGGEFSTAGGNPVSSLARYQNGAWSDVGGGVQTSGTYRGTVYRLRVLDDGSGPALYVAGYFARVQGQFTPGVASWRAGEWTVYPPGPGFIVIAQSGPWDVALLETTSPPTLLLASPFLRIMPNEGPEAKGGLLAYTPAGGWVAAGPPGDGGTYELFWDTPDRLLVAGRLQADPDVTIAAWAPCPSCYANCDRSTAAPILNIDDFTCFINAFAAAGALPPEQQLAHYANCDRSTTPPALNIDDFTCFINQFAVGCP